MALGDLSRIESAFAEAAMDPALWVRALDVAMHETGSFGAVLLPVAGAVLPNVPVTETIGEVSEHYFRDGWHLRDHRNAVGVPTLMKKGVADDFDFIDLESIKKHPFYQEFLAPHGLRWFAGIKVACGDDVWCVSIQRRIEQGPFPLADKLRLADLSRTLGTSAALARALAASTLEGAMNAFEMSRTAIALVNRHGDIYRINGAAEKLLRGELRLSGRRIVCRDTAATAALDRAIFRLMWRVGAAMSPPVALPRSEGNALLAYPARLSAVAANALADCQAIIVLVDPDDTSVPPESVLQACFSLSPAESRVVARLGTGASLQEVSEQLAISKETGRAHLKNVFAKLGISRQTELIALLAQITRFWHDDRR